MNLRKKPVKKGACFFDIDGVLNTSKDWSRQYTFRSDLVANLCRFVKERNLDLIMTSSWRVGFVSAMSKDNLPHIQNLEEDMYRHGIRITNKTPVFKGKFRDDEIKRYLDYHPYNRVIVLDDDPGEYSDSAFKSAGLNFLFTDSAKGFDAGTLKRAMKMV